MEVIKQNETVGVEKYTRVLFMDDDVEIVPETLYRTLMLANYLREEYKESFITGAMMDLYEKNINCESIAIQSKLFVASFFCDKSMSSYENILNMINIPDEIFTRPHKKASSAWWYQCFNLCIVAEKGLPVPVFLRGDDIEWCWRHFGKRFILMNGFGIWHAPFSYKVSSVVEYYYTIRNMFIVNIIHTDDFKVNVKQYLKDKFYYLLDTYNYNGIRLFLRALDDILGGSAVLMRNPEKEFNDLNMVTKEVEYFDAKDDELMEAEIFSPLAKRRSFIYKLTRRGIFFPSFLYYGRSVALEWLPSVKNFMLYKEVKVYNPLTKKYCVRKFDKKLSGRYRKEFYCRIAKIKARYDDLYKDYRTAYKRITSLEYWEEYLGIGTSVML
jgi:hypothetical protein